MDAVQFEKEMSTTRRLSQVSRTACRVIDGKAVVITIDESELHVLNTVGTRVWELADGRPLSQTVDHIVEEFQVSRSQALDDVVVFVRQLLAVGALEVTVGDGS